MTERIVNQQSRRAPGGSLLGHRHLPNLLTVARIFLCPLIAWLILNGHSLWDFILAYYLFVAAGLTDIYDGILARRHQNVTTFGKLVDPVADKLLLAATLVPFYLLTGSNVAFQYVTLTILLILLGRELLVTLLRYYGMWTGHIFAASRLAKFKTASQMFFIGSVIVQVIHGRMIEFHPDFAFPWFAPFHHWLNRVTILAVVGLSLISAAEYVFRNLPIILRRSRA